ncbi:Uncharacterized protein TCM_010920 [Theobroma cacao]|uniref:Reverse transcriptase zinc-binding domain-containing protein n=1 Tax=Theobroma cacao TaxID=3641 RepID=A0A061E7M4_THECC|nr:Uncharacterized protein TCM_010920 [Theobroma cacao]
MLTNEVIHSMRGKLHNKGGIVLKLDFEKAFDRVDWEYISLVMQAMGFGHQWCSWIYECISMIVGDGAIIFLWLDKWLENPPFSAKYPCLILLATDKETQVADAKPNGTWLNDCDDNHTVWFQSLWKLSIPPKVQFFLLLTVLNTIPTKAFLFSHGVQFNFDQLRCVWCDLVEEPCPHIFLTCNFSWLIWGLVLLWWGVAWCVLSTIFDFIQAWSLCSFGDNASKRWMIVYGTILCCALCFGFEHVKAMKPSMKSVDGLIHEITCVREPPSTFDVAFYGHHLPLVSLNSMLMAQPEVNRDLLVVVGSCTTLTVL